MIYTQIKKWMEKRADAKRVARSFITLGKSHSNYYIVDNAYFTKLNKINMIIGSAFVVYGGVTFFLPTGSVFAIAFGLFLFSCPVDFVKIVRNLKEDVRFYVGVRV